MNVKKLLAEAVARAAMAAMDEAVLPKAELPEVLLEIPPEKSFGDFATNFAMQAARPLKANPKKIAEAIVARLEFPWLDRAEIAGPGFINFYLHPDWLYVLLQEILDQGQSYGNTQPASGKKSRLSLSAPIRLVRCMWDTVAAPLLAVRWPI